MLSYSSHHRHQSNHGLHIPHSAVLDLGGTVFDRHCPYPLDTFRVESFSAIQGESHIEPDRWRGVSAVRILVDHAVVYMSPYILIFLSALHPTTLGTYNSEAACTAAIRTIYETKMYGPAGLIPKNPEIDRAIDIQLKYQTSYRCVPK